MNGAVQHGVAGVDGVLLDHPGAWIKRFAKNIGIQLLPLMYNNGGVCEGLCLARRNSLNNIEL
jgi:hypothetical protein